MMKTIFERDVRAGLIERIGQVSEKDEAQWGKMNVYQMLRHNTYWNRWILGEGDFKYKHEFLGKLFGKIALKRMIRDDKPFDKNVPTSDQFKVKETSGDLENEKSKWIALIGQYENYHNPDFVHDFFGNMTKEQVGILAYKHTDHHLRQFGL